VRTQISLSIIVQCNATLQVWRSPRGNAMATCVSRAGGDDDGSDDDDEVAEGVTSAALMIIQVLGAFRRRAFFYPSRIPFFAFAFSDTFYAFAFSDISSNSLLSITLYAFLSLFLLFVFFFRSLFRCYQRLRRR
jgi:hypothetical protein